MRALLANLGFVSQMSGIFMIIPIIISFVYKENSATIALMITAMLFMVLGFILNSLCERKDLSFKDSNRLIFLTFILLGIIGAIPYLYINATNTDLQHRITDSIFESVSGYTTTGFSLISNPELLPKSINFYRGLTQFIGGIGIVLLLLVFFYSEEKLGNISKSLGFEKNNKLKHTFFIIALIYVSIAIIFGLIAYFSGYKNIINSSIYIFAALSGGGFEPVADISKDAIIGTTFGYIVIFAMIIGAINIIVLSRWATLKFKDTLKSEVPYYFGWIIACFLLIKFVFNLPFFDTLFHTISANTTNGFQYINIGAQSDVLKVFFVLFMLVGATSISSAGGVKIFRILLMLKAIHKSVHESITEKDEKITLFGKEYRNHEVIQHLVVMILYVGLITVAAFIFHFVGEYDFTDSLFVTTSAATTTGLDVGIIKVTMLTGLKWLIIAIMLLGRVEIFAFLIMFSRAKEEETPIPKKEEKEVKKEKKEKQEAKKENEEEVSQKKSASP